jgi:hypothetical protein
MNGGLLQPGCKLPPVDQVKGQIKGIADLAKYPVEGQYSVLVHSSIVVNQSTCISYILFQLLANGWHVLMDELINITRKRCLMIIAIFGVEQLVY